MINKSPVIDPAYQHDFSLEISRSNLQRGLFFAPIIIGIELILLIVLIFNSTKSASFKYSWYASMYILMIVVTIFFWTVLLHLDKRINNDLRRTKTLDLATTSYIAFTMVWGASVSLIDQALYGSIMAFLVNVLIASFMFYLRPKYILISQLLAAAVLFIGLPYYQPSENLLIGHYANASIFLIFIWLIARANYTGFVRNFLNKKTIEEKSNQLTHINSKLVNEIQTSERVQEELEAANEQLRIISTLDALTGIPNRRRLDEVLWERWRFAIERKLTISIMMIDIDFFKLYNDTNGHLAGDRCLQAVAEVLNGCRRESLDFVARFGGEEFLFVAVGLSKEECLLLGERIRLEVEALGIEHQSSSVASWITISVGISYLLPDNTDKLDKILEQADKALYRAKSEGRNQIVLVE